MQATDAAAGRTERKRPLGVWLLTVTYATVAMILFVGLLLMIPEPKLDEPCFGLDCDNHFINPWDSMWGIICATCFISIGIASVGAFLGKRLLRLLLTATFAIMLLCAFVQEIKEIAMLRGIPSCSSQLRCSLSEWVEIGSPLSWVPWTAWFAFHCWYLFGPRTCDFYAPPRNA
jgi:hypothetical protein